MNEEFRSWEEAVEYRDTMLSKGMHAYIEEFCDFDGFYFVVLVW